VLPQGLSVLGHASPTSHDGDEDGDPAENSV
jgi:hypothetical protein